MTQPEPQKPPEVDSSERADFFSDYFSTHLNPWSFVVTFGERATVPGEKQMERARVRMPLQQAKAMAVLMMRAIRDYEQRFGIEIELPPPVLEQLRIPPEDWKRFSAG